MSIAWEFSIVDLFVLIAVILVIALIVIARIFSLKYRGDKGLDRKFFRTRWQKIEELFSYGKEMNYKLAVIEADKLLDEALKVSSFPGNTMAERIKVATYKHPKLKEVWWAHKVRNHVVHDVRYILKHGESKMVLRLFKKALKELSAL